MGVKRIITYLLLFCFLIFLPTSALAEEKSETQATNEVADDKNSQNVQNRFVYPAVGFGLIALLVVVGVAKSRKKAPKKDSSQTLVTKIVPGNAQHIGLRKQQQDAFGFIDVSNEQLIDKVGVLAVLADGMGGLAMGQEVSNLAVKVFLREYEQKRPEETIPQGLYRATIAANKEVFNRGLEEDQGGNVGTTLVAAVISKQDLYWISVGDSRAYLYRKGQLVRLTKDHIFAHHLEKDVEAGKISNQDAENHPDRQALTSFLGLPEVEEIEFNDRPFEVEIGDVILLCSDGLYGTLSDEEIKEIIAQAKEPQLIADKLIEQVNSKNKPLQDNITAAVLVCR